MTGPDIMLLVTAIAASGVLAWTDARCFEIDLECLAVLAAAALAWSALAGPEELARTLGAAALTGGVLGGLRWRRPARIGAGDPWLAAVAGGLAGPGWLAPFCLLAALVALAVSAAYARVRGLGTRGRVFSIFPLALALCPAMLAALAARLMVPDIRFWEMI